MANTPLFILLISVMAFLHSSMAQRYGMTISKIEAAIRDRAFVLLRRTNELVDVALPANLSAGIEAFALRIRSNALWAGGANSNATAVFVRFPPRVLPAPYTRRVVVVFVRFAGNSSNAFFSPPHGYLLVAPVVALLAYDASGTNGELTLQALGAPVHVEFKNLTSSAKGFNTTMARCLTFGSSGQVAATHAVVSGSACKVSGTGHFGVAMPVEPAPPPLPPPAVSAARWEPWLSGVEVGGGVIGLGLAVVGVAGAVSWRRRKRRQGMERRAAAGEELGRVSVSGSRMPLAKMVRTRPEVEEGSPPPWRKG